MYVPLLLTLFCATGVLSNNLITPCKTSDQTCLIKLANDFKNTIYAGIPELDIKSFDPLFIPRIQGDFGIFNYKLLDTTHTGFSRCNITTLKIKDDLTNVICEADCTNLNMKGKYEMHGTLIAVPAEGKGDYSLTTGDYFVQLNANLKKVEGKDGKTHLTIKNFKLKTDPKTAIKFRYEDMFDGDKKLSDNFHKFIGENWDIVAKAVEGPIWNTGFKLITSIVNKYAKVMPVENFIKN